MEQNEMIANRLKSVCTDKKISYRELAEKSNVPVRQIYRMTYGQVSNPSVFVMMRICDALEISLDEFFGSEEFKVFRA